MTERNAMFDIGKAIAHLQSIAILAVKAQEALQNADSTTCADLLDSIEDDIAVVRDNAPGLCW